MARRSIPALPRATACLCHHPGSALLHTAACPSPPPSAWKVLDPRLVWDNCASSKTSLVFIFFLNLGALPQPLYVASYNKGYVVCLEKGRIGWCLEAPDTGLRTLPPTRLASQGAPCLLGWRFKSRSTTGILCSLEKGGNPVTCYSRDLEDIMLSSIKSASHKRTNAVGFMYMRSLEESHS